MYLEACKAWYYNHCKSKTGDKNLLHILKHSLFNDVVIVSQKILCWVTLSSKQHLMIRGFYLADAKGPWMLQGPISSDCFIQVYVIMIDFAPHNNNRYVGIYRDVFFYDNFNLFIYFPPYGTLWGEITLW